MYLLPVHPQGFVYCHWLVAPTRYYPHNPLNTIKRIAHPNPPSYTKFQDVFEVITAGLRMNAITSFIFTTVIIALYGSSPGGAFSTQHLIGHHITKRQTDANDLSQVLAECSTILTEYQCGPSGYAQETVNIALGCRNESLAHRIANTCARNENGETCGAAATRFFISDAANAATCISAVGSGSCPSNCSRFLESARSRLGCCINTYINTTDSPLLALYSNLLDYRLWNLCDVPLPPTDCRNTLSLNPPQNSQQCTAQELTSLTVDYECRPSVAQPLINTLLQNNGCNIFATTLVDICATNANGQYCAEALGFDLIVSTSTTDPLLVSLFSNCAGLEDTCSQSCQSTITSTADAYGCCINVYNNTELGQRVPSLSYSLWNSCGVETPGVCNSSLTTSPTLTTDPQTTFNNPTTTSAGDDSSSDSSSSLEFATSTSGSGVLAPVNWIIVMASLLYLKNLL